MHKDMVAAGGTDQAKTESLYQRHEVFEVDVSDRPASKALQKLLRSQRLTPKSMN